MKSAGRSLGHFHHLPPFLTCAPPRLSELRFLILRIVFLVFRCLNSAPDVSSVQSFWHCMLECFSACPVPSDVLPDGPAYRSATVVTGCILDRRTIFPLSRFVGSIRSRPGVDSAVHDWLFQFSFHLLFYRGQLGAPLVQHGCFPFWASPYYPHCAFLFFLRITAPRRLTVVEFTEFHLRGQRASRRFTTGFYHFPVQIPIAADWHIPA